MTILGGLQAAPAAREMIEAEMTVTRGFKELAPRRVARDAAFAENPVREGVDAMLTGDMDASKAILALR